MNPTFKNILAVVVGIVIGNIVNMGIVMMSSSVIPPPEGVDVTNMDALKAAIPLFEPKHFIMPFLAHALGTFVGAYLAARIAVTHKINFALGIGVFFLIGGVANIMMLGGPLWFTALDLVLAYIPMGYVAGRIAKS